MNLLVTGGCGFIGSNFIRRVLLSDEESDIALVINLDKLTYAGNSSILRKIEDNPRYAFVHGDIADDVLVAKLLRDHHIDAVLNFAAETHVDRSIDSPEPFFETNVIGTLRLLNACGHHWAKLHQSNKDKFRFLHVSTDEVYGSLGENDPPFTETSLYAPNSPYAASKASADFVIRSFFHTYGLPVLTTNCSNNYGPYQFPEKLIPLMILNALDGRSLPVYGDGMQIRDWLYVEDHITALLLLLKHGWIGESYNVGGLNQQTNISIVTTICEILDKKRPRADGKSYRLQISHVVDRPGHDRRYAVDCSKIQKQLGWAPAESFLSGIEKTVDWYLQHSDWCRDISARVYQRQRLGMP